jgi:signal transduction histidine kinase
MVQGLVLCLPFAGLFLFKFYANQLVQQTEESLLTQGAVLASAYASLYAAQTSAPPEAPDTSPAYAPVFPSLSLRPETILPPRPDAIPPAVLPLPEYAAIGPELSRIATAAQAQTLAGYRLLDPGGTVIGGTAEVGLSLAHVDEVARALAGQIVSVARERLRQAPEPVLYDISRGTRVRVFVALPVVVHDQVIGAVYISRTPNHIFRFLYGERFNLLKATIFILASTTLIGFVFWRFITRPILALIARTQSAGTAGTRWTPPAHFGTREIETLSHSFQSLTERLQNQQDALKTYTAHVTHELKSPLTAVKGAAELLRDDDMSPAQQSRFLDNIDRDITRMEELLSRMRAFSLADQNAIRGTCTLAQVQETARSRFPSLEIAFSHAALSLPLHHDTLNMVLTHLLENAQQHGADRVVIAARTTPSGPQLTISDNGSGISAGNSDKVFTPFFTTKREKGGTGMGLNIVKAIVEALNAELTQIPCDSGAQFQITFNAPSPNSAP